MNKYTHGCIFAEFTIKVVAMPPYGNRDNFNPAYIGTRTDIVALVPTTASRVLDAGCSIGVAGKSIKEKCGAKVVGIEIDKRMAKVAKNNLDKVIIGDVEKIALEKYFPQNYFDCIISGDVLEHLKDPWSILKKCVNFLSSNGLIIASIPNIRHYSVVLNLIFKGYWPYRARGIRDMIHLRFFTLKNFEELFAYANLDIIQIKRNYRILEAFHWINRFSKFIAIPGLKEFLTFQCLIVPEGV